MDLDTLARLSKGSDLAVLVVLVRAHADGVATVAPSALMAACDESDKTLKRRLMRLKGEGLVESLTSKRWRMTPAGCVQVGANPEVLRLTEPRSRNISGLAVDNSTGSRNISEMGANIEAGIIPGWRVNAVSFHREPGNIPGSIAEVGNSDFVAPVVVSSIKSQYLNHKTTTAGAGEVDRLLVILKDRAPYTKLHKARGRIVQLLEAGHVPDQIELDILGHCARLAADKWAGIRAPAGVVLSLIDDGHHAGPPEREALARGQPGEADAYAGYLEQAESASPDLQRFDELTKRLGVTQ